MFDLDKEESKRLREWDEAHECELKEYSGAIGGRLTYQFTPTGLGCVVKIICGCGEEIDVTDYGYW